MEHSFQYYSDHYPLLSALLVVFLALLAGLLFRLTLFGVLRRYAAGGDKGDRFLSASLQNRLKGTLFLFIPGFILHIVVGRLDLPDPFPELIRKIADVVIVLSLALIAKRLVDVGQDMLFRKYDISVADNYKARKARTQIIYINKIAVVVITVLASGIVLLNFDGVRQYGATILTGAGVAGIIIGFALQKTLANLFAGIQIAFTQPIKIDDAVVVEGEWGWIDEINLTYVVVRIWDKRRLILPITYFTDKPFQNWTRSTAQILGSVFLYTDYNMPLEPMRQYFKEVLEGTDMWDRDASAFQVTETSEHGITIRLLMTARNSPVSWDLRCYVREKMVDYIQQNYPQCLPKTRAELGETPYRPAVPGQFGN